MNKDKTTSDEYIQALDDVKEYVEFFIKEWEEFNNKFNIEGFQSRLEINNKLIMEFESLLSKIELLKVNRHAKKT
ncbi:MULTISPECIES: hypothetical protein [Bacillus subtilis group]|uniref:hypothetical protein n=1 Tax=Bacillus velezensis TaxID=492670 RepID=UPI000EF1D981|nr:MULTISPECIES: hypothetical protein [Bacillus subtilis group]AYK64169.1 hypothetical protein D9C11_00585 [Bacillus subtilis subsp. subtilis]MEC0385530.1 hypothetical protein [Bacillus velezensis]UBM44973.1 hypothetical protein LAZ98_16055 [Bacillus velezensis]